MQVICAISFCMWLPLEIQQRLGSFFFPMGSSLVIDSYQKILQNSTSIYLIFQGKIKQAFKEWTQMLSQINEWYLSFIDEDVDLPKMRQMRMETYY